MTDRIKASRFAVQALVALMLGACAGGGGGGGGGSALSPPPPPPPVGPPVFPPLAPPHADADYPNITSTEFTANWGPGGANAQIAWQNGATGAGILVGVIDDGIHPEHPELQGRISPASIDIYTSRNALVTNQSHGSELSSLIAGNYNGSQTVGVAYDATILAVRADNGGGAFTDSALSNAIDYARAQGVDVINLSLGSASPISQGLRDSIRLATEAGIIFVVSAGNDGLLGATSPNYPGVLASNLGISNGLIIVAGGLNSDGSFNNVSNPAGLARDWYLTAPGWQILVPDYGPVGPVPGYQTCGLGVNGDLCRIQGTSYASPHVAGAVALVMEAFPGLTPAQVVDLLFTTADDTGAAGTDSVHGRGRLNIGRAFAPVGPLAVPLIESQGMMQASAPVGFVGAAFGDGFSSNAVWSVAGFDHYNRTFAVNLGANWRGESGGPAHLVDAPRLWRSEHLAPGVSMQMALADDVAPDSYRLPVDRADLELNPTRIEFDLSHGFSLAFATHGARTTYREGDSVGHLDFVRPETSLQLTQQLNDVMSVSFISETGAAPEAPALTLMDAMRPTNDRSAMAVRTGFDFGQHEFEFTTGQIHEDRGLLGLTWSDSLGATPSGETRFGGVGWRYQPAQAWRVNVDAEFGVADFAKTAWLNVEAPLRTTSYGVEVEYDLTPAWLVADGGQGTLRFGLSQPMRVESGVLSFVAPTATKYGLQSLRYERRDFTPTPTGRELRASVGYNYFAGDSLSAFGEMLYVTDPGHVADAESDAILRLGVRVAH